MAMNENFKAVINTISDWIIRIVIINLLIIFCSLPIITFFPALISGYSVMDDYIHKREVPLMKTFFTRFMEYAKIGVILGVIFLLAYGINTFNYLYFTSAPVALINTIGIYVSMVSYIIITMMVININIIIVRQKITEFKLLVKVTFVYSIKFFLRTLFMMIIVFSLILLYLLVPLLFFLVGFSAPIFLTLMVTNVVNKPKE